MRVLALAAVIMCLATGLVRAEPMVLGPFVGVLPCADCPGVRTELTLTRKGQHWAEGTYRLQETYLGREGSLVTTGEWTTLRGDAEDEDAVVYELNPDKPDKAVRFAKDGERQVRLLDREMRPLPTVAPLVWAKVK